MTGRRPGCFTLGLWENEAAVFPTWELSPDISRLDFLCVLEWVAFFPLFLSFLRFWKALAALSQVGGRCPAPWHLKCPSIHQDEDFSLNSVHYWCMSVCVVILSCQTDSIYLLLLRLVSASLCICRLMLHRNLICWCCVCSRAKKKKKHLWKTRAVNLAVLTTFLYFE